MFVAEKQAEVAAVIVPPARSVIERFGDQPFFGADVGAFQTSRFAEIAMAVAFRLWCESPTQVKLASKNLELSFLALTR